MKYYDYCQNCGADLYYFFRSDRKYCDNKCRQAAYRKRKSGSVTFAGKRNRGMIK